MDQSREAHRSTRPLHSPEGHIGPVGAQGLLPPSLRWSSCGDMLDAAVVGGDMEISDKNEAVAPDGEEQARQERQQPLARPASRATAVAVAILDITGILVTLAAVAVHRLNGEANRWWWAVGIASLLAVFTTVLLIRIWIQRRLFIKASLRLAQYLEDLAKRDVKIGLNKRGLADLREQARARRDAALASGDLAVADRLAVVLARLP
jgi:hypothetical protein